MAKKIRFPLEMNGVGVRTLEELRENFSLVRILMYYENGKLLTWLRDRYLDDIAERVEELNKEDSDFNKNICTIFGVEYDENSKMELEEIAERNRKIEMLKQYTDEKEYIDNINYVAFEQDDLYDLLDQNISIIYLCGERFTIPIRKQGVTYKGVNRPIVVIHSEEEINWEEKGIILENVQFDEEYTAVIQKNIPVERGISKSEQKTVYGSYNVKSYLSFMLSDKEREQSKALFNLIKTEMCGITYDINRDIEGMLKIIKEADLYLVGSKFIEKL